LAGLHVQSIHTVAVVRKWEAVHQHHLDESVIITSIVLTSLVNFHVPT